MLEEQENDHQKRVEDGLPIKLVYLKRSDCGNRSKRRETKTLKRYD